MGRLVAGILAGFSGRVGPVSGSSWKGIGYMKTRPASVAVSQSAGSVIARTKWGPLTKLGSTLLAQIVKPLWDRFAQRESGYNAFIRANYDAVNSSGDLLPASIITSKGTLDGVASFTAVISQALQTAAITWPDNSGSGNAVSTDSLFIAVYSPTEDYWVQAGAVATRDEMGYNLAMGGDVVSGVTYWLYIAFRRADGSLVSNSQSMSKLAVA